MKTKVITTILFMAISLGLFAQTISISPNKAGAGQTFPVTINGKNTKFLTGVNTINFVYNSAITSDAMFSNQNVVNDSVITGNVTISNTIPNPYGFSLRIANTINPPINLLNGISIPDADTIIPRLYPISGSSGNLKIGSAEYLNIRGKNTHLTKSKNNIVKFYKYGIESNYISVSSIQVSSPIYDLKVNIIIDIKAKTGIYSMSIENEIDGLIFKDSAFVVVNPNAMLINSITQRIARRNEEKDIDLVGYNTKFNANLPTILFTKNNIVSKDIEVLSIAAKNDVNATARLNVKPTAELGYYTIAYFYPADLDTMYLNNYFLINAATGTNEITENAIKIFPNPAKNLLNIESKKNITNVYIFDITGKEIFSKISEKETQNLQLDLTEIQISKGIYLLKVQSQEGLVTQKIIIE